MKEYHIGLLFPETQEEILEFDEESKIRDICNWMHMVKSDLRRTKANYTCYYDSTNLKEFADQIKELYKSLYLDNAIVQLREMIGRNAVDVNNNRDLYSSDCIYRRWRLENCDSQEIHSVLKVMAEKNRSKKAETIILSFLMSDSYGRSFVPVIKDAWHIASLPLLSNIPYYHPAPSFLEELDADFDQRPFVLSDKTLFDRTNYTYWPSNQRIYQNKETHDYWYYDFFHRENKEHYEVFSSTTYKLLGEANMNGEVDYSKADDNKSIEKYITGK